MGVTFTEGLSWQIYALFADYYGQSYPWGIHTALSADSAPWTGAEAFGDTSIAVVGGVTLDYLVGAGNVINVGEGSATLSQGTAEYDIPNNPDNITLYKWFLWSSPQNLLIWGGYLDPPWNPPVSAPSTLYLEQTQVVFNQCGSSSFAFLPDGSFETPSIPVGTPGNFVLGPTGGTWSYSDRAGIAGEGRGTETRYQ